MKQPNILWITSDQQHFSTLGILNDKIKTPNLDRLAREGMLFDRTYCPNLYADPGVFDYRKVSITARWMDIGNKNAGK